MSLNDGSQVVRRRRGAALESALLDAAWDELAEKGYDAFAIESVAARAQTARAVIYRRWATKAELVHAAIVQHARHETVVVPDTGTLRGDLIELAREATKRRVAVVGVLARARIGTFYGETGIRLADLRDDFLAGRPNPIDEILDRAAERGEADPARLTPRVRSVTFDLLRHEILMTQRPVPDDVIVSIVDEIVLPLVRPG